MKYSGFWNATIAVMAVPHVLPLPQIQPGHSLLFGQIGQTGTARVTLAAVANDYSVRLKAHGAWARFPVRVYFARDASYTPLREQEARAGFSRWTEATNGYISFKVTDNSKGAQMFVRFNPASNDGFTTTKFSSGKIIQANISVGVERGWPNDVECIAAHEFGHALGINGHSDNMRDLMYPTHTMGASWSITQRDLNTLAAIYKTQPRIVSTWFPRAG